MYLVPIINLFHTFKYKYFINHGLTTTPTKLGYWWDHDSWRVAWYDRRWSSLLRYGRVAIGRGVAGQLLPAGAPHERARHPARYHDRPWENSHYFSHRRSGRERGKDEDFPWTEMAKISRGHHWLAISRTLRISKNPIQGFTINSLHPSYFATR